MPWWTPAVWGFLGVAAVVLGPLLLIRLAEWFLADRPSKWGIRPRNKG